MTPSRALLVLRSEEPGHGGHGKSVRRNRPFRRGAFAVSVFAALGGWLTYRYLPEISRVVSLPWNSAIWITVGTLLGMLIGWLLILPVNAVFRRDELARGATGKPAAHLHRQREALPWWIFGVLGGWLAHRYLPELARTANLTDNGYIWTTAGTLVGLVIG